MHKTQTARKKMMLLTPDEEPEEFQELENRTELSKGKENKLNLEDEIKDTLKRYKEIEYSSGLTEIDKLFRPTCNEYLGGLEETDLNSGLIFKVCNYIKASVNKSSAEAIETKLEKVSEDLGGVINLRKDLKNDRTQYWEQEKALLSEKLEILERTSTDTLEYEKQLEFIKDKRKEFESCDNELDKARLEYDLHEAEFYGMKLGEDLVQDRSVLQMYDSMIDGHRTHQALLSGVDKSTSKKMKDLMLKRQDLGLSLEQARMKENAGTYS
jgi:hypothetical protein